MRHRLFLISALTVLGGISSNVQAAEPRMLQSYGDWDAYTYEEGDNKVCYMAATPNENVGNYKIRGDIHALITHRPSEGARNVFSYIAGYTYKAATDAVLEIDGKKFILFTKDDTAWALKPETDKEIAEAIRTGSSMTVSGVSSKGTKTKDTFSLSGSSAAYERISKECN